MKSLTAVCQTGASMPAINPNGRISRHPHHRGDGENAEMKMYLSKLKDLVPFMPKDRKLSKLEIIQYVIDYICDLQSELETHPDVGNFDPESALNYPIAENGGGAATEELFAERLAALEAHNLQQQSSSPATRQPLVDRQAPNTILPKTPGTSSNISIAQVMQLQLQQQQQQLLATAQSSQSSEAKDDSNSSGGGSRPQC